MNAAQVVKATSISRVWRALGGGELRRGRGQAWWRSGDGWNVSLNDRGGVWYDHRDGVGGGILDLIRFVRGCSSREALLWLADLLHVTLDNNPLSPEMQQRYQRALRDAPSLARAAALWWAEQREFLERMKAEALDRGDLFALASLAHEHYRLGQLSSDDVIRAYLIAQRGDPSATAALVATGENRTRWAKAAVVLIIARLAREAGMAV